MSTFVKASLIRAARTVAQVAASLLAVDGVTRMADVDWIFILSASVLAGILSILTSIATGLPEVKFEEHLYMSVDEPNDSEVNEDGEK